VTEEEEIQGDIDFLLSAMAAGSKGYLIVVAHGDGSVDIRSHGLNVYEEPGVLELAKMALLLDDEEEDDDESTEDQPPD
jgi:hypothetical protein